VRAQASKTLQEKEEREEKNDRMNPSKTSRGRTMRDDKAKEITV
jgi:hypothetical protein